MLRVFEYLCLYCSHYSVNSCLAPICSMRGLLVTTVEGIGSTRTTVHPVSVRDISCLIAICIHNMYD